MENVSGSASVSDGVSGLSGTGGDTLFSFDPINAVSKKRRNKKLEAMQCWPQVKHMLDNGLPVVEIVHYIQNTRKEYTHVKPNSLRMIIYQWLGSISNRKRLVDHRIPVRHVSLINSNQERIDPIDAMNMLFAIQMDRVLMGYERERQKGKLEKENGPTLKLAMEMLSSLADMQRGSDPRPLTSKGGSVPTETSRMDSTLAQMDRIKKVFEERWGSTAAEVMLNPESRNKLFNAIHKVRKTSGIAMTELIQRNTEKAKEMGGPIIEVFGNDSEEIEAEFHDDN